MIHPSHSVFFPDIYFLHLDTFLECIAWAIALNFHGHFSLAQYNVCLNSAKSTSQRPPPRNVTIKHALNVLLLHIGHDFGTLSEVLTFCSPESGPVTIEVMNAGLFLPQDAHVNVVYIYIIAVYKSPLEEKFFSLNCSATKNRSSPHLQVIVVSFFDILFHIL